MGGAHNVLLKYAKDSMDGKVEEKTRLPSQEAMGGAHNVAMAVLAEQSNRFIKQQEQQKKQRGFFNSFASPRAASPKEMQANMVSTGKFLGFLATLAICIASFITVKTYHAHLEKQDQLMALLKNPNARVASGKKGKLIAKKIALKAEAVKVDQEQPVEDKLSKLIAAAKLAKAKKAAEETISEQLLTGYEAPKLLAAPAPRQVAPTYQLVEPVQQFVQPVLKTEAQPVNGYWYPQNFEVQAPLPVPQMVAQPVQMTKVAMQQPEPMRESLPRQQPKLAEMSKKELIKALLLQLAKEGDLESQL